MAPGRGCGPSTSRRSGSRRAGVGVEHYTSVSASADASRIVATQETSLASLWTVPIQETVATERDVKRYPLSSTRAWVPRVRGDDLWYLSSLGTADGLWRERGGETVEVRKGTQTPLIEPPAISPDGRYVVLTIRETKRTGLVLIDNQNRSPRRIGGADRAAWRRRLVPGRQVDRRGRQRLEADGPL